MSTSTSAPPAALAKQPATAVVGYGLGDFANNLAFSMSTQFLLLYYTDVALMSASAIGLMFLVVRLWDAVADLVAGRIVDSTRTKWGKFRPFLMFVAIPVLFLSFLSFNVPTAGQKWLGLFDWSPDAAGKLLYAYLTYAVFGLVYSLINIPYGAMASAMTQSVHERAKLVSSRAFGSAFGGLFLTYIVAPLVDGVKKLIPLSPNGTDPKTHLPYSQAALQASWDKVAGHAGATLDQATAAYQQQLQSVFTLTTLAFVLLGSICYWLTAAWCRETVLRSGEKTSFRDTIDAIKSNTALQILCGASFFYLTGLYAVSASTAFFAQWILGSLGHMPVMALVNSGVALIMTPLIPSIIKRLGKKTIFQFCGLFTVVGGFGLWFIPVQAQGSGVTAALIAALILLGIKGLGASLINTVMFGLGADTIEYGEWKTGRRTEGATYSIFSFTRKITQSIGGAVGAQLLAIGGYLAGDALIKNGGVQPLGAVNAIKFTIGPFPAICAILAMLVFMKYPMSDQMFDEIRDENENRKLVTASTLAAEGA